MTTHRSTPSEAMLGAKRQHFIMEALGRDGAIKVVDLAADLGVSLMTIRRDLDVLENDGLLRRVHGGAVIPSITDTPASTRDARDTEAKRQIGARAAELVAPGSAIFLGSGTTVAALARSLVGQALTVVTHSLLVVDAFRNDESTTVHSLGGRLRPSTMSFVGPSVQEQLGQFSVASTFVSASALADGSFFNYRPDDSALIRASLAIAGKSWLLIDASKIGATAVGRVGPLSLFTGVVTDATMEQWHAVDAEVDHVISTAESAH